MLRQFIAKHVCEIKFAKPEWHCSASGAHVTVRTQMFRTRWTKLADAFLSLTLTFAIMRESASSHVLAVQLKRNIETGYLIPDSADVDFVRLAEYLCTGLTSEDCAWDSERASLQTIPKKRAKGKGKGKTTATRSSTFDKHQRQAKRMKLDDGIIEAGPQCTQVPAPKHVFEICFIAEDKGERDCSEEERSLSCERDIIHSLIEKHEERGEGAIEIGTVFPHAYGGSVRVQLCTSGPLAQRLKNPIAFTSLLPKIIDENVKDTDFDFHSRTFKDILCCLYHAAKRYSKNYRPMEAILTSPYSRTNLIKIPFKLCIEVCIITASGNRNFISV